MKYGIITIMEDTVAKLCVLGRHSGEGQKSDYARKADMKKLIEATRALAFEVLHLRREISVLQGEKHPDEELSEYHEGFICPRCGVPMTTRGVDKIVAALEVNCSSCGYTSILGLRNGV